MLDLSYKNADTTKSVFKIQFWTGDHKVHKKEEFWNGHSYSYTLSKDKGWWLKNLLKTRCDKIS